MRRGREEVEKKIKREKRRVEKRRGDEKRGGGERGRDGVDIGASREYSSHPY